MRVISTAGHVDHGKSALVLAMTGMDPDRLREEKERQMTIDLGFAWMTLEGVGEVGIIDVPGHRDFIENMLAGVGGIDAAILVVAADEGVMPQTREHLAILDILGIQRGLVAITKVDLIDNDEWLTLVKEDVIRLTQNTSFAEAPIIAVSAITGSGMEDLQKELGELLKKTRTRTDLGKPRLPVDRAFTISGFGTVVTGTLLDGSFSVGQEIEVLPKRIKGRIRGLQTHKTKVETAVPGSRTAINLSGIDVKDVVRGEVIALPGTYEPTDRIDVHFKLMRDAATTIEHNQHAKLFLGSAQRVARLRLLGVKELQPGDESWLQIDLDEPIIAERGDHYILRRPSPTATLGGGKVGDAHPTEKHRLMDAEVIRRLYSLLHGSPAEVLWHTLASQGPITLQEARNFSGLDTRQFEDAIQELLKKDRIILQDGERDFAGASGLIADSETWRRLVKEIEKILQKYHDDYPLRLGMPREELNSRINLEHRVFDYLINELRRLREVKVHNAIIALADHKPVINTEDEHLIDELMARFRKAPFGPPSVKEVYKFVGEEVFRYLLETDQIVQVSEDVVFLQGDLDKMKTRIREEIQSEGKITVGEVRDIFDTSRKYALALMEHLDSIGMTIRKGDYRILRN